VNDTEGSGIGYSEAHLTVTDHGHLAIDGCDTARIVERLGAADDGCASGRGPS
jgi:hypothetical protein